MVQGLRLARKPPCHLVRHQEARDAVVRCIPAACDRTGLLARVWNPKTLHYQNSMYLGMAMLACLQRCRGRTEQGCEQLLQLSARR